MIGLGLGLALEHKFVNFEINPRPGEKWRLILRIFIGIILVSIVYLGFYLIIDTSVLWLSAFHYILTLLVGIVIWPFIFKKFGF